MHTDVVDLRDFYISGPGQTARRLIRRRVREFWPDTKGLRVLGVGFASPYLRPFQDEAERVVAAMPASQGVLHWPPEGPGRVVLTEDTVLPFPDRSFDRILLVHALEGTEATNALMREVWRVMTDSGRLLVVVPNRQGLWARLERTPFATGRPFSVTQLNQLLRDTLFMPLITRRALFLPPVRNRLLLAWAPAVEEIGARWFPRFSGIVMTEASKQLYAAPTETVQKRQRAYLPLPEGLRLDPRAKGSPRPLSQQEAPPGSVETPS